MLCGRVFCTDITWQCALLLHVLTGASWHQAEVFADATFFASFLREWRRIGIPKLDRLVVAARQHAADARARTGRTTADGQRTPIRTSTKKSIGQRFYDVVGD